MRFAIILAIFSVFQVNSFAQDTDHLTEAEIAAAVAARPDVGFTSIMDAGFLTPTLCNAQMPTVSIFTPIGWINAQSYNAKKQFLPYHAQPEDTLRALTVVTRGCAGGTPSGPTCDSITRVIVLSDKTGSTVIEAILSRPMPTTWHNGFGATSTCSSMISKFDMKDIEKARNTKGEFIVATFAGATPLKSFTVKPKHLKSLGLK